MIPLSRFGLGRNQTTEKYLNRTMSMSKRTKNVLSLGSLVFIFLGGPTDDMHLLRVNIDRLPSESCVQSFPSDENQPIGYQESVQICAGDTSDDGRDTCQVDINRF